MRCANIDAFYRCGITHCGKVMDEEKDDCEIYPDDDHEDRLRCKVCAQKLEQRQQLEDAAPRSSYSYSRN